MMAALVAAESGADVALLEKDTSVPCNSELAGALVAAAGTRQQKAAGINDSPELFAKDIAGYTQNQANPEVTLALCRGSAGVLEFLETRVGLSFGLSSGEGSGDPSSDLWLRSDMWGHAAPRYHRLPTAGGREVIRALREAVRAHSRVLLMDRRPLQQLLEKNGAVVGVEAGVVGPAKTSISCRNVVLASGGFGANRTMTAKYMPEVALWPYRGALTATGDGILQAMMLGAAVDHMGSYHAMPHLWPLTPGMPRQIRLLGGIAVNRRGERFIAEDVPTAKFADAVSKQPETIALEIFDKRIADAISARAPFSVGIASGAVRSNDSIVELARSFGIDGAVVEKQLERYNKAVAGGGDSFGRLVFEQPLRPPYYGGVTTLAFADSKGGLRVNTKAEVLRADGTAIRGLYAAGDAAVGIAGERGCAGYLGGNGLLSAFGLGAIAGRQSAQRT